MAGFYRNTNAWSPSRMKLVRSSRMCMISVFSSLGTDKGVSSMRMIMSTKLFVSPTAFDEHGHSSYIVDKVNEYLPEDIRVFSCMPFLVMRISVQVYVSLRVFLQEKTQFIVFTTISFLYYLSIVYDGQLNNEQSLAIPWICLVSNPFCLISSVATTLRIILVHQRIFYDKTRRANRLSSKAREAANGFSRNMYGNSPFSSFIATNSTSKDCMVI